MEPEPVHLDALREYLQSTDGDSELHGAGELAGALERLSGGGVDAVILDPDLPDSQGIVSFERMYAFAPNVPVIVLTNEGGTILRCAPCKVAPRIACVRKRRNHRSCFAP